MNDSTPWKILGIERTHDEQTVKVALRQVISKYNFRDDIDAVFSIVTAYRSIRHDFFLENTHHKATYPWATAHALTAAEFISSDADELLADPESFITKLKAIYGNPMERYNIFRWRSAVANVKLNTTVDIYDYCPFVVAFLSEAPHLKSHAIQTLKNAFPFQRYFGSEEWSKSLGNNPVLEIGFALLQKGNLPLDLYIDSVDIAKYSRDQLDQILDCLQRSLYLTRMKDYRSAFNVLAQQIPQDIKPLVVWQREITILSEAAMNTDQVQLHELFLGMVHECHKYYPDDSLGHYLRAKFYLQLKPAAEVVPHIIETIVADPLNDKSFFLLAKCYAKLGWHREANQILRKLVTLNPLNLSYVTFAASVVKPMIVQERIAMEEAQDTDRCIRFLLELTELNLFEEIETLSFPRDDPDTKAILLYAQASKDYFFNGTVNKPLLYQALALANRTAVVQAIVRKQLEFHSTFGEIAEIKDFLFYYLEVLPDDDVVNAKAGSYYFFVERDYSKALEHYETALTINPDNTYLFLSIARTLEYMKRYDDAIRHIVIYQQQYRYDAVGYEILGRCSYNIGDYYRCYQCYKWIFNIKVKTGPSALDHFFLLNALWNFLQKHQLIGKISFTLEEEIKEALDLFRTAEKIEAFVKHEKSESCYFYAAKLSASVSQHEWALNFLEAAFEIADAKKTTIGKDFVLEKVKTLVELNRYQEVIDFLDPYMDKLLGVDPLDHRLLGDCSFYLTFSYAKLDNRDKEFEYRHRAIDYYAAADTDSNWLENYIFSYFERCVERESPVRIIITGNSYHLNIVESNPNHIYVSYWMAVAYQEEKDNEQAIEYYKQCIEHGNLHPASYTDLVEEAKTYVTEISRL